MYENFYGLSERPFRILPDPDYLFLSTKHLMALTYLEYGLMNQAGFIVITGEIGTGKTTLIRTLLRKLDLDTRVASIFNTSVTPAELLEMVLREFEIPLPAGGKTRCLDCLYQYLIEQYRQGRRVVLIVDEAQNLSLEALEEIRLISNLQTEKEHIIQILLVGQPGLRAKLAHPRTAQFAQRISVHYHLGPLDSTETQAYVEHRLKVAGFKGPALFSPAALKLIFEASRGIPRLINILCDAALVYGYADGLEGIDRATVEQVVADKKEGAVLFAPSTEAMANETAPVGDGTVERLRRLEGEVEGLKAMLTQALPAGSRGDKASLLELENLLAEERRKNQELLKAHHEQSETIKRLTARNKELEEHISALLDSALAKNQALPAETSNIRNPSLWARFSKLWRLSKGSLKNYNDQN